MSACIFDSLAIEHGSTDPAIADHQYLRIALFVNRALGREWLSRLLHDVKASMHTIDCSVILFGSERKHSNKVTEPWLWRLWCALDRMLFASPAQLSARKLASDNLGVAGTEPTTAPSISEQTSKTVIETLRNSNLDLIIQVGGSESLHNLSDLGRFGAWWVPASCCVETSAAWFWSMYQNRCVFETEVKAYAPGTQQCQTLGRSVAATDHVSLERNKDSRRRKVCELLVQQLATLQKLKLQGLDSFKDRKIETDGQSDVSNHRLPTNAEVAKFLSRWLSRAIGRKIKRWLWREHWFVAYRRKRNALPTSADSMQDFQIVASAKDRFYADPFCLDRGGKTFLFFEDYPFDKGKGLISYIEIDNSGKCSKPQVALQREYHLSYPHVFEHDGEVYMVPESLECRRVDLYRAINFPRHWILERTLLDNTPAVDPTVFFHNGKVWLFVSGVRSKECINEELFLFFSDFLLGQWTPHPCNPIVSDVRKARPAGRIFVHDGTIVRPAQDCSHSYGRAITFHRIDILSETAYQETPIATLGPEWHTGNLGTHTFNQSESIQTIDGRVLISKYQRKAGFAVGAATLRAGTAKAPLTLDSERAFEDLDSGEPLCAGDR